MINHPNRNEPAFHGLTARDRRSAIVALQRYYEAVAKLVAVNYEGGLQCGKRGLITTGLNHRMAQRDNGARRAYEQLKRIIVPVYAIVFFTFMCSSAGAQTVTTVDLSTQIRNDVLTVMSLLITGFIGIGLTWMRTHLSIMQDAAMNATITDSAKRFGGLLVEITQKEGNTIHSVDLHDPRLATLAASMLSRYPQFKAALNLTPDTAAHMILGEASVLVGGAPAAPQTVTVTTTAAPDTGAPPTVDNSGTVIGDGHAGTIAL